MLSYQHIYHAGCIADVHKHSILSILLSHLIIKEKPLSYFETHAGRGLYDLESPEAQKTGEAKMGIISVLRDKVFLDTHPYLQVLKNIHSRYGNQFYPGSPVLADYFLRPMDSLHLMELHPQEIVFLKKNLKKPNIHIHFRDGYGGVLALSPPIPRRGFVFIDPSYEVKNEYSLVVEFIKKLHNKWPEAIIGLWYPKLKSSYHEKMVQNILGMNLKNTLINELDFADSDTCKGMYGGGMLIVNAPFGVDQIIMETADKLSNYYLRT